jgi:trans-aconitate 2-methyltransferase
MARTDWNPELYLKFGKERTQPAIDLVSQIHVEHPRHIIDIGCGPGNSTQVLVQRWPQAKVTGLDNSPAMIENARKDYPQQEWRLADAGKDVIDGQFDIVFSNATIQWIPDHETLLARFYHLLSDQGLIAIQVPQFWDMPIGKSIARISQGRRWKSATVGVSELLTIHNYAFYYDCLAKLFPSVEMWETYYMHVLDSHNAILEMISSTGLRPYLERLETTTDKEDFTGELLAAIRKDYPLQENGKVIFPFKRLFFIARK